MKMYDTAPLLQELLVILRPAQNGPLYLQLILYCARYLIFPTLSLENCSKYIDSYIMNSVVQVLSVNVVYSV